MTPNIIIYT